MGINFPTPGAVGEVFNAAPGLSYVWDGTWRRAPMVTALPENKITNPAMQHSQQNGDTTGTASGYYLADEWQGISSVGGFNFQRLAGPSPNGNRHLSAVVATAQPVMPATGTFSLRCNVEGRRVAELRWGNADAKQLLLAFWVVSTQGGTYSVAVRNGANDRTFLAPFTVPAGGWHYREIAIPGDITGTWAIDSTTGVAIDFSFASGSDRYGVAGWQAGSLRNLASDTNGASTVNNIFYIADVGLYFDPYKTGVAPPFETPNYVMELRRCQRYWYKLNGLRGTIVNATTAGRLGQSHMVQMRTAPSLSLVGSNKLFDGTNQPNLTGIGGTYSNDHAVEFDGVISGTVVAGRPGIQYYIDDNTYVAASARM